MNDEWRANWSRHFDQLQWTSTTIFTAAVGGLLVYCYQYRNPYLDVAGLWLTLLTVYYNASFRSTRRQLHEGMCPGAEREFLTTGASLPQWPVFLLTFMMLTVMWLALWWQHGWRWIMGCGIIGALIVFAVACRKGHLVAWP